MAWEKVIDIVGPPGTVDSITVETIPAGVGASATVGGTPASRTAHFKLERGLPGTNAVANDDAFSTYINVADSKTRIATNAAIDAKFNDPAIAVFINSDGATRSATSALVESYSDAVYPVWKHGLRGDWVGNAASGGGTNDTAAFAALIEAAPPGATLVFDRRRTYRLDPTVIEKPLTLDFQGSTVATNTTPARGSEKAFLWFRGAAGPEQVMNTLPEGSATVSGAAGTWVAGDWVVLSDSSELKHWETGTVFTTGRSFVARVESVSGTTLSISEPSPYALTVSPRVRKLSMLRAPRVLNLNVNDRNPGATHGVGDADIVRMDYCLDPLVSDLRVRGWQNAVVRFEFCAREVAKRIHAEAPFRPLNGGHGHVVRHINSIDGITLDSTALGARHLSNYVQSVRCGSRHCKSYASVEGSFQTHGWDSVDCYSDADFASGPATGWQSGNNPYASDRGFTVTNPTYAGTGIAALAWCRTSGMTISHPNFTTSAPRGIVVTLGAADTTIDLSSGKVSVPEGGNPIFAASTAPGVAGSVALGDLTVIGDRIKGGGMSISVTAGNTKLSNVNTSKVASFFSATGQVARVGDPSEVALVTTFSPGTVGSSLNGGAVAGCGYFARVQQGGSVSKIGIQVLAQAGNLCVAVYRGGGVGSNRRPSALVATSGSVACPAPGYAEINLGTTVQVEPGDFLFVSRNNTGTNLMDMEGGPSMLHGGSYYLQWEGAFPAPASLGSLTASNQRVPLMIGRP